MRKNELTNFAPWKNSRQPPGEVERKRFVIDPLPALREFVIDQPDDQTRRINELIEGVEKSGRRIERQRQEAEETRIMDELIEGVVELVRRMARQRQEDEEMRAWNLQGLSININNYEF